MSIRPIAIGLTLCELVIIDEKTRHITTANCFSRRVVEGPLEYMAPFYVFFTVVNGHGKMPAKLVIQRLDTLEITYEHVFALNFRGSLQELMGIFRIRSHYIPVHGVYQAMLFVDGEPIAQRRFEIILKGV